MKTTLVSVSAVAMLAVAAWFSRAKRPSPAHATTPTAHAEGTRLLGCLPVSFVPNLGQWQHPARFVSRIGAMTVFLERNGWTFTLVDRIAEQENDNAPVRGVAVRMTFAGASAKELVAEAELAGHHNYFLGNDPGAWRSEVPLYRALRYREVQPGVDVRTREQDGHFEFDVLLQPGAELEPVEIVVEGVEHMVLDDAGALVLETRLGPVRMPLPLSFQEGPSGERSEITCRYELRGEDRFGFVVAGRRPGWALTVDPGLVWSTFLGGTGGERAFAVALDAQGAATVSGWTLSADFPTTSGAFDPGYGFYEVFVTRLASTGSSLVYSTFLGGGGRDEAFALALDAQGAATVVGNTESANFPTTSGAFDTSYHGGQDAFVARLSPTGSRLVYSTFLGGGSMDAAYALALDAHGAAAVAGNTGSSDFPTTTGAFDTSFNGGSDAFVTRLSPTGSRLLDSTFLGGTGSEVASALALDAQGAATVAGSTNSTGFPTTTGAFDTSPNGGSDAFVTRLSPTGSTLVYSTLVGGRTVDSVNALALAVHGAATVVGITTSTDFPTTTGAFDTSFNGGTPSFGGDAFVARLSPLGSSLVYSTFLGGVSNDSAFAVALDARGATTVAGTTNSADFPTTTGAFDTTLNGSPYDAFVTRLSPSGSSLVYSTFLGGTSHENAYALALDAQDVATVAGNTGSSDFPITRGAFDTTYNGGTFSDAFVTRLDMLPTGVAAFGRSSAGCTGSLAISVTSMPRVGNQSFALTCSNAPPNTTGLLAFTGSRFPSPILVLGVELWIDPTLFFVELSARSNQVGASDTLLPIPNDPALAGGRLFAQFFWAGPTSPPPCPPLGLSTSNALDITIQP